MKILAAINTHTHVCVCVCVYIHVYVYACIYIHLTHTHAGVRDSACVFMHVSKEGGLTERPSKG